jgi:hypothetical protein
MIHADSVANKRQPRTNLDGGRPVHPAVLHLEGHVEELVALTDDARALGRIAHLQAQIARVASRLAEESKERAERLQVSVIPEVQRCYAAAEAALAEAV